MEQQAPTFRDASDLAKAAIVALAAIVLLNAGLFAYGVAKDGAAPPKAIRDLHLLIRVATAFAFIAWLNRVYANVEAFHGETAHERFWAVAGFFVPPFLAFRPCEITAEAWRRSSRSDEPPVFVYAWWTAFVLAPVLALLGRTPMAQLMGIAAAGLAIFVVHRITSMQLAVRNAMAASNRAAAMAERRARMASVEVPAPAPSEPPPPPAPPPQLAPHLAAIDAATARRAAERRESAAAIQMPPVQTPRTAPVIQSRGDGEGSRPTTTAATRTTLRFAQGDARLPQSHDDVWARILSVTLAIAALTMFAVAMAIMVRPDSQVVAGVYGGFAVVLLVIALIVGRHRVERNSLPDGWVKIAIFGMAVVAANIIVSIGAAVR